MEKFTENLSVEQYLVESEKTLSAKYRYSEKDPQEIELYKTLNGVFDACNKLDVTKKRKFYGKPVDPAVQLDMFRDPLKFHKGDPAEKVLHGVVGICTEAGELVEIAMKNKFEGIEYDKVHVQEELGDLMWYVAILLREFDIDFNQLLTKNINKLLERYQGAKFSEERAINRDLNNERKELEK